MASVQPPAGLTISIKEHEYTLLNADNAITRFDPRGQIIVNNRSRKFAVWDAELELNRQNRTTLGTDALNIGRLDPLSDWEKEFMIKGIDSPMLLLTESIDTFSERVGINNALVFEYQMPVEISLQLRNHSGATIQDIVVTKEMPPIFKDIHIQKSQIGKAEYDSREGRIVWTIKELSPDQIAVQRIRTKITAEDTDPKSGGKVHVTYKISDVVRSTLVPVLHGSTEMEVSVEKEEHPMRVGSWRCKAALTNSSEFPIRIQRVQIVQTAPDNDLLYEGTPNHRLEPGEVWGHEFEVKAIQPEFDIIALSSVEAPITNNIVGTIEKAESVFHVLRIEGKKRVEPQELLAWEPAPVAVTLQAKNTGTIDCDEIIFTDPLPAGFEAPETTQIRVRVQDKPITRSLKVDIRPKDRDLKVPHTLSIQLLDLTEHHTPIKPGDTVTVNFITIARAPKPNYEHTLPVKIEANTFPPGPKAIAEIPESIAPVIKIRSVVRKLRKTRTVTPSSEEGELIATVTFVNEGESNLQDPELQDLIPPNFEFVGVPAGTPEPKLRDTLNGTVVSWVLPTMMSRESFVGKYKYRPK
ncbi:MAG: hypothetical protein ACFFD8_05700, partial [Candidatus Thorarchaeota archaeon]